MYFSFFPSNQLTKMAKVSVLDGGLKQWKEDGYAVESGDESVVDQRVFSAKPANPSLLKNFDEVLENQKTDNFTLIECRQPEWFDGSMDSIWPSKRKRMNIKRTVKRIRHML